MIHGEVCVCLETPSCLFFHTHGMYHRLPQATNTRHAALCVRSVGSRFSPRAFVYVYVDLCAHYCYMYACVRWCGYASLLCVQCCCCCVLCLSYACTNLNRAFVLLHCCPQTSRGCTLKRSHQPCPNQQSNLTLRHLLQRTVQATPPPRPPLRPLLPLPLPLLALLHPLLSLQRNMMMP